MLLANSCSMVTWGPRAVGLVSVLNPWGSILMLLEAAAGGIVDGGIKNLLAGLIGKQALAGLLL